MPFAKVDPQVDFPAQERNVLDFWQATNAFEKLRAKNRGKPRWSFLDGPITANNPMGVHHAWGRTYKDAFQRYFAMTGREERYQNGFDCQGLWVEVEVEKELKLRSKRDIESLVPGDRFASIDKFVRECKARVDRFARVQTEQSIRLGYWMDWDRPEDFAKPPDQRRSYYTMSEENNYSIWSFLKKCFRKGLVYRGFDAMPWCPRCGVGISQMEMHEGYRLVEHTAVFVRFPLRGRPGENLLVWTTTPWTLSSNVGAAVNPDLTYLKVRQGEQVYYVAKGAFTAARLEEQFKRKEWVPGVPKLKTLEQLFKEKKGGYEVVGEVKGSEMVGWAYDGPFDELPAQRHPAGYPEALAEVVRRRKWAPDVSAKDAHRVVAWAEVGETEGTGIVHIAPGCGKEDFALGKEQGLPPVAPLDEGGHFIPGFGELTGKSAVDPATAEYVIFDLDRKGRLFATERYPHTYPHCWRCKTELLFRLVDEWFINMGPPHTEEGYRGEIMQVVREVTFLPPEISGQARERDWLWNMGDWMISKKRYWGLALPIWVDDVTGEFEVIGSREELKERAVEGWEEFEGHTPHRPWIDKVKIRNPRTGNLMSRIPDVGNPWLDAGIVPFSTMGYNTDRAYWEKWFPADFITESFPGQFRNWFYAILAMSTMMVDRAPMKVLLGHALVRDEYGREMHKSAGNAIPFEGAADEGYTFVDLKGERRACAPMGADVIRWLFSRQNPAANINFGPDPADEVRSRFVLKLWNTYSFFCNYARLDQFDPAAPQVPVAERSDLDRWILSDLQLLIKKARESFESFNVMTLCLEAESFVDDRLSNWYVRRSRRRFWKGEQGADKQAAYQTLYTVLTTLTKLLAPVIPFLTETMHQNLRTDADPESVHLCDYPEADESLIDAGLSEDMAALLRLVSLGSAARNAVKIKVRQPLAEMKVQPGSDSERRAVERFADQLSEELNIKRITLHDASQGPLLTAEVRANLKTLGPRVGAQLQEVKRAIETTFSTAQIEVLQSGTAGYVEVETSAGRVAVGGSDVTVNYRAPEGFSGVADRNTQVVIDARINDALKAEGMAREVVRFVQDARKAADLEIEDRIALYLHTDAPALRQAIDAHRDYIAAETLTTRWADQPLNGDAHQASVKVDGQPLTIALERRG
jgi:isoleucyl-tRNA synthetase